MRLGWDQDKKCDCRDGMEIGDLLGFGIEDWGLILGIDIGGWDW